MWKFCFINNSDHNLYQISSTLTCFTFKLHHLYLKPFGVLAVTILWNCVSFFPAFRLVPANCKYAITLVYIMPSLLLATHLHAAPTPLPPVVMPLASVTKAVSWTECPPFNCMNLGIWDLLLSVLVYIRVLIEVLISSSNRDITWSLGNLERKILCCGPGAKRLAQCYVF